VSLVPPIWPPTSPPSPPVSVPGPPVSVPGPPAGPGVRPPFVAPPTDGARRRRWLAIGLAGAALLVCCLGGVFGAGGLVVLGNQMILDEARGTVSAYLGAVRDKDYAGAYALLCDSEQSNIDEGEFVDMFQHSSTLRSFTVGEAVLESTVAGDQLVVPVTLAYTDGHSNAARYLLDQDTSTGAFEVCGQTD
jgi:hypothetical protein